MGKSDLVLAKETKAGSLNSTMFRLAKLSMPNTKDKMQLAAFIPLFFSRLLSFLPFVNSHNIAINATKQ